MANGGFAEVVGGAKVINNKGNGIFVAKVGEVLHVACDVHGSDRACGAL